MRLPTLDDLRPYTLPAAVTLAAAIAGYAASGAFAGSDEVDLRTEQARARIDRIQARLPQLRARAGSPAVICDLAPAAAQTALEGRLSEAATRTGVVWRDTRFQTDARDGYLVTSLRTTAEGPYAVVIQALAQLAQTGPTLFVERMDIRPSSSGVSLELEGSQLCSTSRS